MKESPKSSHTKKPAKKTVAKSDVSVSKKSTPRPMPKSTEKFQQKMDKKRARLEYKLKNLDKKALSKQNLFLRILTKIGRFFRDKIWRKITGRARNFLSRRPHRSLYLTPRAKTKRGWKMRGYFGFIHEVWTLIWQNKWLFTKFLLLYALFSIIIVGMLNQGSFVDLREALNEIPEGLGIGKWMALFSGAITGGGAADSSRQIIAVLLFLYGWLTLIWLLRRRINGDKVKLRDGLYSGGSPVLATLIILGVVLFQLIPLALVLVAYSSVTAIGWINTGIQIENMAAWCVMAVAAVLTLYWVCSSLIALIIVTLPGMYPFAALKAAGDLVVGRRLKLVIRLIFMALPAALMWIVVLLTAILIDSWLELTWQPLVPTVVLLLTTLTIVWFAAYVYLLYRRMVDDPEPPVSSAWQQKRAVKKEAKKSTKKAKNPSQRKKESGNLLKKVKKTNQK
ncbi:hypothetical protein FWG95_01495 [Candidatus Saccharibacteria bacterium]|nr:hypothetical protein [Candidatus Saccharibacteria bacterium]